MIERIFKKLKIGSLLQGGSSRSWKLTLFFESSMEASPRMCVLTWSNKRNNMRLLVRAHVLHLCLVWQEWCYKRRCVSQNGEEIESAVTSHRRGGILNGEGIRDEFNRTQEWYTIVNIALSFDHSRCVVALSAHVCAHPMSKWWKHSRVVFLWLDVGTCA